MGFWRRLRLAILGRFPSEMEAIEKYAPCTAATVKWYEGEIAAGNGASIGMCWFWPDKRHWKGDKPGQKHSVGYYIINGRRVYIEPQEGNRILALSENELSLAQHIGP
jgi:hypothetical protein